MSEPSVLTYARYFDLAQDHTVHDPLKALNALIAPSKTATIWQSSDERVDVLVKEFEKAASDYIALTNNDIASIPQDVVDYLKSCMNHTIQDISQIFNELLPDPYRIRKLKLDLPLLVLGGGDVERDAKRIRKGIDLQLVIDDVLVDDDDDEKGQHQKHESSTSSVVSAEILEWSKTQHETAMKKEKLDVNLETMKYMRQTLSGSIEPSTISRILLDSAPKLTNLDSLHIRSLTEDDFQFDVETNVSDSPDLLEFDENDNEQLRLPIERELDMLSRLDAAVDEEFLQSTQADRDMDELFRQFTHHDSDCQGKVIVNQARNTGFEDLPPAKRQKLVHENESEMITQDTAGNGVQDLEMRLEDIKIEIPHLSSCYPFALSVLDLSAILGQGDRGECSENKRPDPGPLPFRIPTIHEALHDSMPTQTKVTGKFLIEEKAITSSDRLLWKEPGLRVLDEDDAQDSHIVAESYEIEEWAWDTPKSISPNSTTADFFRKPGHREDLNRTSHNAKRDEPKIAPAIVKREPVDNVHVKKEFQLEDIDVSMIGSGSVLVNPFARAEALFSTEPKRVTENIVENRASKSTSRVQKSQDSPKLSSESTDRKPMIARYEAGLKSLLPEAKRRPPVLSKEMGNASVVQDSLSSFLDLRGKQFKLPAVKRICEAEEVFDDPILLTQDSLVEEWFSDEPTLTPSLTQPVQSIRQEVIPPITPLEEPRTIVVNSVLLQTKPLLIQFLESPDTTNLTLIYRDIDLRQNHSPDLILNTTTCLFITNLQSLNQRPLPGQSSVTGLSSAHDRVANLACSYSQIIVLIHHTIPTDNTTQSKTVSTQASFAAFCQNFMIRSHPGGRSVQPYWLPCINPASTSDIVNACVWQVIDSCAYRNGSPKSSRPGSLTHPTLIQEETLWELFLCKAGLNTLAAQVVISSLKRSSLQNRVGADQEVIWGLRRLVAMSSQERVNMFGDMIGADVIERLNVVLSDRDDPSYGT